MLISFYLCYYTSCLILLFYFHQHFCFLLSSKHRFGRKVGIIILALIELVFAPALAASPSVIILVLARGCLGVGVGMAGIICPMYPLSIHSTCFPPVSSWIPIPSISSFFFLFRLKLVGMYQKMHHLREEVLWVSCFNSLLQYVPLLVNTSLFTLPSFLLLCFLNIFLI